MVDTRLDGGEVGDGAAEPALVDVVLPRADGLFLDGLLRLLLRPHHEDALACGGNLRCERARLFQQFHGLLKVNDVDPVPLGKNKAPHPGVPPVRLMTEVDACLKQRSHAE